MATSISDHIAITPAICGGKPRIAGTRIRTQDIVIWHDRMGQTPDQIVANFPQLTLVDVHAALAYYFDHVDEINHDIRSGREFAEQLRATMPAKVAEKLKGADGGRSPLSSG